MMPQLVTMETQGHHNRALAEAQQRLQRAHTAHDLSTVIVCPTRGSIHAKVVQSWMGLVRPMNQVVVGPLFAIGLEVGEAYQHLFSLVTEHPDLKKLRYILTIEEDNVLAGMALMQLLEAINGGVDRRRYDAMGALYWTKGEGGQPMIYGQPGVMPLNFRPQVPQTETVQPCNGLGMGCTLFRASMFHSGKIEHPWFKTSQGPQGAYTQDLYFFERAGRAGFQFACDTRVRVGHYDAQGDIVW